MFTQKKSLLFIATIVILVIAFSSVVYAFSGACYVEIENSLFYNSIKASFYANRLTSGSYQTVANKHIIQCYVRLIEGSYDSGRVYSSRATSIYDGTLRYAYTGKADNWLYQAYSYWGWLYF